jgi:hypothetical protein
MCDVFFCGGLRSPHGSVHRAILQVLREGCVGPICNRLLPPRDCDVSWEIHSSIYPFLSYFFAICEQRRLISRTSYFVVSQACLCIGIVCELNKACGAYMYVAQRVTSRLRNVSTSCHIASISIYSIVQYGPASNCRFRGSGTEVETRCTSSHELSRHGTSSWLP